MESPRQVPGLNHPVPSGSAPLGVKFRQWIAAWSGRAAASILAHRRRALAGLALGILALTLLEHLLAARSGELAHWVYDLVVLILFFPPTLGILISLLESAGRQSLDARAVDERIETFSQKINDAENGEEVTRLVVEFAHQVAPQASATLWVTDPESLDTAVAAVCHPNGQVTLHPDVSAGQPPALNPYDLPLARHNLPIGLIRLEYPSGGDPGREEITLLKNAAPIIALALDGMQMQALAAQQVTYNENLRQQIAQNLHDTLAQNISYLRLKLDQLTDDNADPEIHEVLRELARMRASADEAYLQVRDTLDKLNPNDAGELFTSLLKQARAICQRSDLALHSHQIGVPFNLPLAARQQVILITREALHNIEKHACAHQVHLQAVWLENELILKITDDGIGFDPSAIHAQGHYGLWIMQRRAEEIGGSLNICALDAGEDGASGTEVTLWVPRSAPSSLQPETLNQPSGTFHSSP